MNCGADPRQFMNPPYNKLTWHIENELDLVFIM